MNRRKFLLGTSATLAATYLGKPALGPIWESSPLMAEVALENMPASLLPGHITYVREQGPLVAYCRKGLYDQLSLSERKAWNARPIEPIPVT